MTDIPAFPVNGTDRDRRLFLSGLVKGMIGDKPNPAHGMEQEAHGWEAGRMIFARLAGEAIGQAEAFLDVRNSELRLQNQPDEFAAETRLLGYFGKLWHACQRLRRDAVDRAGPLASASALDDMREALVLPPDLEAALEGPRGRAMVDG